MYGESTSFACFIAIFCTFLFKWFSTIQHFCKSFEICMCCIYIISPYFLGEVPEKYRLKLPKACFFHCQNYLNPSRYGDCMCVCVYVSQCKVYGGTNKSYRINHCQWARAFSSFGKWQFSVMAKTLSSAEEMWTCVVCDLKPHVHHAHIHFYSQCPKRFGMNFVHWNEKRNDQILS